MYMTLKFGPDFMAMTNGPIMYTRQRQSGFPFFNPFYRNFSFETYYANSSNLNYIELDVVISVEYAENY